MIRIWQSYSCNNSSAYRLLARFIDATTARSVGAELDAFFASHAVEIDARNEDTELESDAQRELGATYGFAWQGLLYWPGRMTGNTPDVIVEGAYVVVHHDYCGGFGQLGAYVRARGGIAESERRSDLQITVMVRAAEDPALDAELATMSEQPADAAPFKAPWNTDHDAYGRFAWFRDAGMFGIHAPIDPRDLAEVRRWLAGHGYTEPVIRLGELEDALLFEALANARCRSCDGALEYLDPQLHDIESPQLVCRACGGFYEVGTFV